MRIAITTGDLDGIGLEIAIKSLKKIRLARRDQIILFCGSQFGKSTARALKAHGPYEYLYSVPKEPGLHVVASSDSPALWVEAAAKACLHKSLDALVTGPLSKPEIKKAGLKDLGHTEILGRVSGVKDLYMSFWGKHFNVVLITGHRPLSEAHKDYSPARINQVIALMKTSLVKLDPKRSKRPLALLGINPHAGDQGLIGEEEKKNHSQLLLSGVEGPLPGDSAFIEANFKKYGAFLAAYHDQGLIPFKLAHGFDSGVHVTLGLPFLRTSVDHGPAKELFGKNKAEIGSMKAAIEMALSN